MTFNRKALWWLAAFVALFILATNKPAVGIVVATVSAIILDNLMLFDFRRTRKRERP